MSNTQIDFTNELVGLELSRATAYLQQMGVKFKPEYYISDKQKQYDVERVLKVSASNDGTVILTVGRFLSKPLEQE